MDGEGGDKDITTKTTNTPDNDDITTLLNEHKAGMVHQEVQSLIDQINEKVSEVPRVGTCIPFFFPLLSV